MMRMNDETNYQKGIEYEKFAMEMIGSYLDAIKHKEDKIEHDVTLKGLSGATHQIDILITNVNGDKRIVECKNYKSNITKEKIQSFITVRNDIPNVIDAFFFVKKGYQSGAKLVAEKYDIKLIELREYDSEKYNGRITKMKMSMSVEKSEVLYIKAYDFSDKIITENRKDLIEDDEGIHIDLYGYASYFASEQRNVASKNQTFDIDCTKRQGTHIKSGTKIHRIKMEVNFIMGEPEVFYNYDAKESVDAEIVITSDGRTIILDKKIGIKEIPSH